MNRDEISQKFSSDILEAAIDMADKGVASMEVKPAESATKLYKEVARLVQSLQELGICVTYQNTPYQAAVLKNTNVDFELKSLPEPSDVVVDFQEEKEPTLFSDFEGENLT